MLPRSEAPRRNRGASDRLETVRWLVRPSHCRGSHAAAVTVPVIDVTLSSATAAAKTMAAILTASLT